MASIPLSSSIPVRWTPPGFDPADASAPVFLVKAASVVERAHWRRDVAEQGCVYPSDPELWDAIKSMVADSGSENAAEILEAVELVQEAQQDEAQSGAQTTDGAQATLEQTEGGEADGEVASPTASSAAPEGESIPAIVDPQALRLAQSRELVAQLSSALAGLAGPYAKLLAQRQHWMTIAPYLAAQRFCVGWEGASLPKFEARSGRVTEAALAALPDAMREALGYRCINLMSLSGAARKN